MKNFHLFVKGNDDLGTARRWPRPGLEISHEPAARSDLLLQQLDGCPLPNLPAEIANDPFILSQFQSRLFQRPANLVILSLQPEIEHELWVHRQAGYKLCPPQNWQQHWPPAARQWLTNQFVNQGQLPIAQFKAQFTRLIPHLKEQLQAQVIVYNGSTFHPQDKQHNYSGRATTPTIRQHQFNLALAHLSAAQNFYIVDVDRITAAMGTAKHLLTPFHYSPEAQQAIHQELERIADHFRLLTPGKIEWLKLLLPPTELQIESGQVLRWHKSEGQFVKIGEPLLDFQAHKIVRTMRIRDQNAQVIGLQNISNEDSSVELQITAQQDGYLQRVLAPAGQAHRPTDPFALLTIAPDPAAEPDLATIAPFPAAIHLTNP